jgi:serine protease Do
MSKRSLLGGAALVALGAAGAVTAMHVRVGWGPAAQAGPQLAPVATAQATLPPPSPAQLADARALSRTFAQVAAQVSPSVVKISVTARSKQPRGARRFGNPFGGNPFEGTPFERFFDQDPDDEGGGGGNGGSQMEGPKQHGMGSGVVIDKKGFILTNNHVVQNAEDVKVTFSDGKTTAGKVVGTDDKSDLAIVKVDGVDVRPARIGDSDKMQVGEYVMAIGNPFGLDHTVTVGVLSAKNRSGLAQGSSYQDFLQTDASINPGNSGGPLVNLDGEIIGINTMILGPGGNIGIGFAVPSTMAKPIAEQLMAGGVVKRPYLGIFMQDVTPEMQKAIGSGAPEKGALVGKVEPTAPAARAGVKPGDVIVAVDGKPVDSSRSVQRTVLAHKIGQQVTLDVWRDGKIVRLAANTAELPGESKEERKSAEREAHKGKLGLGMQSLTPQLAQQLGLDPNIHGAVIASVRPGSPADEAGVQSGDVLLEVDRRPVTTADDAARMLGAQRQGGHLLRVQRKDGVLFIVIPE